MSVPSKAVYAGPSPTPPSASASTGKLLAAHPMLAVRPSRFDRLLWPLHRWVWQDAARRGRKLLRFAETEAAGGRDLSRAAEQTRDPLLRRLYLRHALDEHRHSEMFRRRGRE